MTISSKLKFTTKYDFKQVPQFYRNSAGRYVSPSPALTFSFPIPTWALRIAVPRDFPFPYSLPFLLGVTYRRPQEVPLMHEGHSTEKKTYKHNTIQYEKQINSTKSEHTTYQERNKYLVQDPYTS